MKPQPPMPLVTVAVAILLGLASGVAWSDSAEDPKVTTLAVVNGEPITSLDLDGLLIQSHQVMGEKVRKAFDYRRLLDRLVNDRLLVQQAIVLGMDEEPQVVDPLAKSRADSAVRRYVQDNFDSPESVSESAVRTFFAEYYERIQLRQVSAATEEEARRLWEMVRSGASMDSLAEAVSVDPQRYRGGAHNLKAWADVENVLRDQCEDLEVDGLSEPFAYRDAYSFVRVEQRLPADEAAYTVQEEDIRSKLLAADRARAWGTFVEELGRRIPVRVDRAVVAQIAADSALVLQGEFIVESDAAALILSEDRFVDEFELRRKISHGAMRAAGAPFDSLLSNAIEAKSRQLSLAEAAETAGWFDHDDVVEEHRKALDEALIQAYLAETIVAGITFDREEFTEYYQEHLEDFRGQAQIRLGTLMVGDRRVADDLVARLDEGADFDFLRKQHLHPGQDVVERPKWSSLAIFSEEMRPELSNLEIGKTSRAFAVAGGWLIFKVQDRKAGEPRSMEEVEMQLREIMFQKEFDRRLDEHLALLKERSEIEMRQDDIREYFGSE